MRKKIGILVLSGLFLMISILFTGCLSGKDDGLSYESDGQFRYHGGEKSYTIIGAEEELPETVYVPSHYKGKEVVSYNARYTPPTTIGGGHERHYSIHLRNAKKVYFPYNCASKYFDWSPSSLYSMGIKNMEEEFYVSNKFETTDFIEFARYFSKEDNGEQKIYVNQIGYEKCILNIEEYMMDEYHGYSDRYFSYNIGEYKIKIGAYNAPYTSNSEEEYSFKFFIQIANTSYLFNYDKAPNDGYFFINEFEQGGKIENTPYEPIREGYTFGGWYKESACTNEWNFDEDKLPEAEHDEDGNLKFVETKLYAKWIKK